LAVAGVLSPRIESILDARKSGFRILRVNFAVRRYGARQKFRFPPVYREDVEDFHAGHANERQPLRRRAVGVELAIRVASVRSRDNRDVVRAVCENAAGVAAIADSVSRQAGILCFNISLPIAQSLRLFACKPPQVLSAARCVQAQSLDERSAPIRLGDAMLPLRDISVAHVDAPTRMPAARSIRRVPSPPARSLKGHREAVPARRLTGRQRVRLSRSPGVIRVAALGTYGGLGISDISNVECGPAVLSRMASLLGLTLSGTRKGLCRINARAILGRGRGATWVAQPGVSGTCSCVPLQTMPARSPIVMPP
jgi:hypothetical protein